MDFAFCTGAQSCCNRKGSFQLFLYWNKEGQANPGKQPHGIINILPHFTNLTKQDRQGAQTHPSDHQIAKCDLSLYRTLLQSPVLAPLYLSAGIVLGDVKLICSVMEIHALELPAHSFVLMFMSEEVWNSRLF